MSEARGPDSPELEPDYANTEDPLVLWYREKNGLFKQPTGTVVFHILVDLFRICGQAQIPLNNIYHGAADAAKTSWGVSHE